MKYKILVYTLLLSMAFPIFATQEIEEGTMIEIEIELPSISEEQTDEIKEMEQEADATPKGTEEELKETFFDVLVGLIQKRNEYVLGQDLESLEKLYNLDIKASKYAFEHESIKAKYLKDWAQKQGVTIKNVESELKVRKVRDRENGLYGMTCNICTTFTYAYNNALDVENSFKVGTSHYIHLQKQGSEYIIVKEWYTDPLCDTVEITMEKPEEMTEFFLNSKLPEFTPNERLQKAIEYAHAHCGIGEGEGMFRYNPQYMDCNPLGGDCANFASQIMFEGGGFKKNSTWNYTHEGTKDWVNAQGLTYYLINSGRGHRITKGSYAKTYKTAMQMRPGDIVAYEERGRITHVSTVTGLDSNGYPLVTCHNSDRLLVPYDLGWSNSGVTYHFIDVYY
ncbi:MAG: amidase domain-containing protein [Epulopiscium sp. Nuni2H_MBin001]|nr:MAG: amidase domain-containing protein [Epulopiscium sp. Nuni2H_MBin001]